MKRKLLFAIVALLCAVGANAQASYNHTYTEGVTVDEGSDYFLYNIENDVFFSGGMDWGTRAAGDHSGRVVTLALSDGAYTIYSAFYSANGNDTAAGYLTNTDDAPFVDNNESGKYGAYTFTAASVDGYTNAYTIKKAEKFL